MLEAIRSFFRGQLAPADTSDSASDPWRLRLAAAALLVELAWVDGSFDERERSQLRDSLIARMELDADTAEQLITLADKERQTALDYFQFTSLVAAEFSEREKHLLLEAMWEVILADGTVSRAEDHLIRRVAPLLGLDNRSVPDAKARVLQQRPRSPGDPDA